MEADIHTYEKGNEVIGPVDPDLIQRNEDSDSIQCTYEACGTKGKYFKCFLDNMFKQCRTYLKNN